MDPGVQGDVGMEAEINVWMGELLGGRIKDGWMDARMDGHRQRD